MTASIRLVEKEDAEFILSLRNNPRYNKYLNYTTSSLNDQFNWINEYKQREENGQEYYFVIFEDTHKKGLYRLYKINDQSFTIGSWIFSDCKNTLLPIISDIAFSDMGFYLLNKNVLLFDVRKGNKRLLRYHSIKSPIQYDENKDDMFYMIKKETWEDSKKKVFSFFGISENNYLETRCQFYFKVNDQIFRFKEG